MLEVFEDLHYKYKKIIFVYMFNIYTGGQNGEKITYSSLVGISNPLNQRTTN